MSQITHIPTETGNGKCLGLWFNPLTQTQLTECLDFQLDQQLFFPFRQLDNGLPRSNLAVCVQRRMGGKWITVLFCSPHPTLWETLSLNNDKPSIIAIGAQSASTCNVTCIRGQQQEQLTTEIPNPNVFSPIGSPLLPPQPPLNFYLSFHLPSLPFHPKHSFISSIQSLAIASKSNPIVLFLFLSLVSTSSMT